MKNGSSNFDYDDVLLPKSRKGVELGSGEIPRHFSLYDYNQYVWDCNMTKEMYRSLSYYAARFNWKTEARAWPQCKGWLMTSRSTESI